MSHVGSNSREDSTLRPSRPRLLQFTLVDMFFMLFMFFVGMRLCLAVERWPERSERVFTIAAWVFIPGGLGWALGVMAGNVRKRKGISRLLTQFMGMLIFWFATFFAFMSLFPPHVSRSQNASAASCKAYAEAQEIYRRTDYDGDGVHEYAQSLGELLERRPGAQDLAIIDRTFRNAEDSLPNPQPKAGYIFKVLHAQGSYAAGGARSYIDKGNMTKGYALVAYPGTYDVTGRDTFIIDHNGTIFQKDLGPATAQIARAMTEFNPDTTWAAAE